MKVVFFDLDETLTDHKYACQMGLNTIMELHPGLRVKTVEQLENEFWRLLNGNYNQVLQGQLSMNETRIERIATLFRGCNLSVPEGMDHLADLYVEQYDQSFRAVPGMADVLARIKEQSLKIAIITNGFTKVQQKKLELCKLASYVDELVTSEEAGAAKPDPAIYKEALRRCNVTPEEVFMIGDMWHNDIECAHALGIRTAWFNRRNEPCPDTSITRVFSDPMELLDILFI